MSPSSFLVQKSSALGDGGTNLSDSKSELNLRTFSVMNAIDGSGGVELLEWFFRLFLFSSSFSLVLLSRESLYYLGWIVMVCSFMLCDLDFEPLSLSLSFMPSCDLVSLTNILILCLILKASNQS
ncbi:hypothetical protein Tco_1174308 [Tanacetum coccineum]